MQACAGADGSYTFTLSDAENPAATDNVARVERANVDGGVSSGIVVTYLSHC
ncbi:MAG: hypothetical protein R2798_06885 [Chitinophagales bacterium]